MFERNLACPLLVTALAVGLAAAPAAPHVEEETPAGISEEISRRAREIAARRHGLDLEQVAVLHGARVELVALDLGLYSVKVDVAPAEATEIVTLDDSLEQVDFEDLHQRELDTRDERYGRVDEVLAERLASAARDDELDVILWLRLPSRTFVEKPSPDQEIGDEELEAVLRQAVEAQQADVAGVVPEVARRLRSAGVEDVLAGTTAPWVGASLRAPLIHEVARWQEVDRVYLSAPMQQSLGVARRAVGADVVQQRGIHGRPPGMPGGIPLGVIEVGGGRIRSSRITNPLLNGVGQDLQGACGAVNDHGMAVASIIRSSDVTLRGVAPFAGLVVGGDCLARDTHLMARTEEFLRRGVRAINYSWGDKLEKMRPEATSRFVDEQVFKLWRTFVNSSGNKACTGAGWVGNPGQAYAGLTVGAYDDMDTPGRGDDRMWPCSSATSPLSLHRDRMKPELVAPGVDFETAVPWSPFTGCSGSGTSYSAPVVTGAVGLLMHRQRLFTVWPNALKALLMVTADHNLEGAARLSGLDGAGGLRVDLADDVLRQAVPGGWGGRSVACGIGTTTLQTISVGTGDRVRFAIAWPTDPSASDYQQRPSADFDLHVLDGGGTRIDFSSSFDRTYEIIDLTATAAGDLRFQLRNARCTQTPRWLSWAWVRL